MNPFIFRMAWRETRGAWRHFLYFFACIAIGVGALVGVSLFGMNVDRAVTKEARGLLGGDVEIRLTHPLTLAGHRVLDSLGERNIVFTHVSELIAMAARTTQQPSGAQATQIIELKAIESAYPLYGAIRLDPAQSLDVLLHPDEHRCGGQACFGAVVQESLLIRMGLSVGDQLKIGHVRFLITGIVRTEPDRMANAFSLGPRVMIAQEGLRAAELIKPGSRVRERYLVKIPPGIALEPLITELRGRLATDSVRISSYRAAQPQLRQFLDQLSRYLGLIGLTALFIGGLGVGTSIHAFLRDKLRTIAILKALGADSTMVVSTYVVQTIILGSVGSFAGILLGIGLQRVFPPLMAGLFSSNLLDQLGVSSELSWSSIWPIMKGATLGLLSTLLFTLWPLLKTRNIHPGAIFRRDAEQASVEQKAAPSRWWVRWGLTDRVNVGTAAGIILGLCALSVWQAGSWSIGFLFLGALSFAIVLLFLCARIFVRLLGWMPLPRVLSLRYAVGNVVRPGGQAAGIMVAIGIGAMMIVTVTLVEQALLYQVQESRPADAPTFFFIDIQPDQAQEFLSLVHRQIGEVIPELTPLVRSRLHAINGHIIAAEEGVQKDEKRLEGKEERGRQWYLTREYVLTFLEQLPKDNRLVKGEWWKPGQVFSTPQVSIEEEAANHLGLEIGSLVELDIQGTTLSAEVSSVRKVEWGNFSTNFYMIFSPGALEGAPHTYVATVRVSPDQEVPLQQAVVALFPNVSAIHIGDVLDSFARVLDRLSLAIRAVALFCVVAGGLVMAAALAATRYRRLYESVILKALGATRGLIGRAFAIEYVLLGTVAGLIGLSLGTVLSWAVLRYLFDLPWTLHPQVLGIGLFLTMLLTLVVGFASTYRILGQRPLAVLRHE
ncbi:MAG: FtsX-like permease family protein [Nitrospirota bacterium]|nr:FtsX-like permease family protein [Nitrospirota bacterium]MDP2382760.1 FtsX-like permease family protein [Nitrospirota bacterium]MDP3597194.1 FtsX-like permease family protein [Nitrospirota bacterium]